MEDFGLETRVIRYHNVYDPKGVYDGGRKKNLLHYQENSFS